MKFDTDALRWKAVQARDKAANTAFVYAVTTTHIFCRPACPSRLARRANVIFFNDAAEAVSAGFRACKRCKPETSAADDNLTTTVAVARRLIEHSNGLMSIVEVAAALGMTPRHLHTLFKSSLGCTPAGYALQVRTTHSSHSQRRQDPIQAPVQEPKFSIGSDRSSDSPVFDEPSTPALDPDLFHASFTDLEALLGIYEPGYMLQAADDHLIKHNCEYHVAVPD